ncbi:hypothetical protein DNU06_12660 [Putridiphycobacter roseus]|uniref:Secretion system C-terminal sorting domain-containing protein n=1 Tax=Putridiphycobacter roseus TaxID=2219161 RepID=A0A2W1NEA8_9FLAO|nr:T9SS type A sorting domain-containing protein [Putridiphycobacter roseus]PZE16396.1 hypothetical protein DNU06_12660 [Putridiphycobacter roseus]
MKKILLFAILGSTSVFAQDLYNQTNGNNGSGIVSNKYTDLADTTVSSADDFTVGANDVWHVTNITVRGFRNNADVDMTSMKVEIFADANGVPAATALYSEEHTITPIPSPVSDTAVNIVLNSTLDLSGGTYWLSVVGATPSLSRWNWSGLATTGNGAGALLIDPLNFFDAGATSWTPLTSLGLAWESLSFKIGGSGDFASVDNSELAALTVYPNPALDVLTLGNVDMATVNTVNIYNVSGQLVSTLANTSNQVDVSELASGSYIVELNTENGTVRKQFMKN